MSDEYRRQTMLLLLIFLPLALSAIPSEHIIGGTEVGDPDRHPWQGSLQFNGGHTCGCILLTSQYVLTAAHCTNGRDDDVSQFQMRFNSVMWATGGELHTVSTITPHPDFSDGSGGLIPHDVCVIEAGSPINGTGVALDTTESGEDCWITGWGVDTVDGGSLTDQLNEVDMEIMPNDECAAIWAFTFRADVHICLTSPDLDKSGCNGDSGGPLVCNHGSSPELRGVTSWGREDCDPSFPSVYARVYNSGTGSNLKPWICETAPGTMGC